MNETEPTQNKMAGGLFIALGLLAGAIIGIAKGQPSAGMMIGFGAGIAIALLIWFWDIARK